MEKDLCKHMTDNILKATEDKGLIGADVLIDKLMESYAKNDSTIPKNIVTELDVEKEIEEANSRYQSETLNEGFPKLQASLSQKGLVRDEDVLTSSVMEDPAYDKAMEEVKEIDIVKTI
jgi:hypothetical protein